MSGKMPYRLLSRLYSLPGRYYHNLQHIHSCLAHYKRIREMAPKSEALFYAIWFHDAFYKPGEPGNEEVSVRIASYYTPNKIFADVQKMILATTDHGSDDPDCHWMSDIDLSVFADRAFDDYCLHIRKEYTAFPDHIYIPARIKILQGFIDRPFIYKTDYFRELLEFNARKNLLREIERLRA